MSRSGIVFFRSDERVSSPTSINSKTFSYLSNCIPIASCHPKGDTSASWSQHAVFKVPIGKRRTNPGYSRSFGTERSGSTLQSQQRRYHVEVRKLFGNWAHVNSSTVFGSNRTRQSCGLTSSLQNEERILRYHDPFPPRMPKWRSSRESHRIASLLKDYGRSTSAWNGLANHVEKVIKLC